jgi:spore germination protein GerM
MDTKKLLLLAALLILLVVLVVIFFVSSREKEIKTGSGALVSESEFGLEESRETRKITLFFLSEEDDRLHPEEREIFADTLSVHQAKQTVEELLKGSRNDSISPFPPETALREIYLTPEGIAYVDFSREIQDNHLSGSEAEISTIYAIVNSLAYNFKSIRRVFILIDGGERETLSGHINLRKPFLPQYGLIAN